ncbi:MAG TPA: AF1514 family protein [Gammaproteobacteria bacterium]
MNENSVEVVWLDPVPTLGDYQAAMAIADAEAKKRGQGMLLSWYDRDRDFESPQHASECGKQGATPGYVDYALNRGANLKVDVHHGRYIFFYLVHD